ncbi:hypothetical protein APC33_11815 [Acinetobacter baumannii]|nr:hypothetical protein APC33_11815 [Acinetobacter baumannii]
MSKVSNEANNFIMAPRAQIECKIKRCVYLVHFSCEKNTIREQDGLNHHLYNNQIKGEFKHEVRQFEKSYDNQQAEQISLMV